MSILKTISKEPEKLAEKIRESKPLWEFFDEARENPKIIYEILKKDEAQQLEKILTEKKEKEKEVKKTIVLKSDSDSGVNDIKQILDVKGLDISYLGSSQFTLIAKGKEFKDADAKIQSAIKQIQEKAKQLKATLEIKEK